MSKTFDLSTLNLSAGTHEITVKARASGFEDSPASNAVSYVVGTTPEETVQVSGTWLFNETLNINLNNTFNVVFTSNETAYDQIHLNMENGKLSYGSPNSILSAIAYEKEKGWVNGEEFRTIIFDGTQTVPKAFYDWLIVNAVSYVVDGDVLGLWLINDTVDLTSFTEIPAEFTSMGTRYYAFASSSDYGEGLSYRKYNGSYTNLNTITDSVSYMSLRYVKILSVNTENKKALAEFLSANAKKVDDPIENTKWKWVNEFGGGEANNSIGVRMVRFICDNVAYEYFVNGTYTSSYKIFLSDGTEFGSNDIEDFIRYRTPTPYNAGNSSIDVYRGGLSNKGGSWISQIYRTIIVKQGITDTVDGYLFYRLLQANAEKLDYIPTEIDFTIDGVTYKGMSNMTWFEWCNSEYNTLGCTCLYYEPIELNEKVIEKVDDEIIPVGVYALMPNAEYRFVDLPTNEGGGSN